MNHTRTAVVDRITDYTMSGARRGPDGRFVRVDSLRERLARPRRKQAPQPDSGDSVAYDAEARLRIGERSAPQAH